MNDKLNEGGSGEGAGEAVDGERGARPRDEEVARATEGVGGAREGEQDFCLKDKETKKTKTKTKRLLEQQMEWEEQGKVSSFFKPGLVLKE